MSQNDNNVHPVVETEVETPRATQELRSRYNEDVQAPPAEVPDVRALQSLWAEVQRLRSEVQALRLGTPLPPPATEPEAAIFFSSPFLGKGGAPAEESPVATALVVRRRHPGAQPKPGGGEPLPGLNGEKAPNVGGLGPEPRHEASAQGEAATAAPTAAATVAPVRGPTSGTRVVHVDCGEMRVSITVGTERLRKSPTDGSLRTPALAFSGGDSWKALPELLGTCAVSRCRQ